MSLTFATSGSSAKLDPFNGKIHVSVPLVTADTLNAETLALEVIAADGDIFQKFELGYPLLAEWFNNPNNATKEEYAVNLDIDLSKFGIKVAIGLFEKSMDGTDTNLGTLYVLNAKKPDTLELSKSEDTKAVIDSLAPGKLRMQGKLQVKFSGKSGATQFRAIRMFVTKSEGSADRGSRASGQTVSSMYTSSRNLTDDELEAGFAEIPLYAQSTGTISGTQSQAQANLAATNAAAAAGAHLNLTGIVEGEQINIMASVDNDAGLESDISSSVVYQPSLRLSAPELLSINSGSVASDTNVMIQFNPEDEVFTHFQLYKKASSDTNWSTFGSATAIDRTDLENNGFKKFVSLSGLTDMTGYSIAAVVNSSSTFDIASAATLAAGSSAQASQSLPSNIKKVMLGDDFEPTISASFSSSGTPKLVTTTVRVEGTVPTSGRLLLTLLKNGSPFKSKNVAQAAPTSPTTYVDHTLDAFPLSEMKSSDVFVVTAKFYKNMSTLENSFHESPSAERINNIPVLLYGPVVQSANLYPLTADFSDESPFPMIQEVSEVVVSSKNNLLVMLDTSASQSQLGAMWNATSLKLDYVAEGSGSSVTESKTINDNSPAEAYTTASSSDLLRQTKYFVKARYGFSDGSTGRWSPVVEIVTAEEIAPAGATGLSLDFDANKGIVEWTAPSASAIASGLHKDYKVAQFVVDLKDIVGRPVATQSVDMISGTTAYKAEFKDLAVDTSYTAFVTPIYKKSGSPDIFGRKGATSEVYLNKKAIVKQIITTSKDGKVNVKVLIEPGNNTGNVTGVDVFVPHISGQSEAYIASASASNGNKEWSTGDLTISPGFNYVDGSLRVLAIVKGPAGVVYASWP